MDCACKRFALALPRIDHFCPVQVLKLDLDRENVGGDNNCYHRYILSTIGQDVQQSSWVNVTVCPPSCGDDALSFSSHITASKLGGVDATLQAPNARLRDLNLVDRGLAHRECSFGAKDCLTMEA